MGTGIGIGIAIPLKSGGKKPYRPVMDIAPAALAAWGTKKLVSSATKCLRVKRSSDNTELDIGFNGNNLDTAALLAFVGAGNGTVSKLYDQAGSHDFGAGAGSLPLIVESGVVCNFNNHPAVKFDGSTMDMSSTGTASTLQPAAGLGSIAAIIFPVGWGLNNVGRIYQKGFTSTWGLNLDGASSANRLQYTGASTSISTANNSISLNNQYHLLCTSNSADTPNSNVNINNAAPVTGSVTPSVTSDYSMLGARQAGGYRFNGYIGQVILWNVDVDAYTTDIYKNYLAGWS